MSEGAVVERYARAIFELGQQLGRVEQISSDFISFAAAYATSQELRTVLTDPSVDEGQRTSVIRGVSERLGLCVEAMNSVRLLGKRRRLSALTGIARRLSTLTDEKGGVVRVKVTSARALPESYFLALIRKVEARTGKRVVVERLQDPSLIAGVVTQIGDNTIDGSLKGRLAKYERQLTAST